MLSQEIEEGELNSDDDLKLDLKTKKLLDDNLIESGELSEDEISVYKNKVNIIKSDDENVQIKKNKSKNDSDQSQTVDNPYDQEDEMMIKLKMKALESLLSKEDESEIKKTKIKKLKSKKERNNKKMKLSKTKKQIKSDIKNEFEFNDDYELKDMDIDTNLNQLNNSSSSYLSSNQVSPLQQHQSHLINSFQNNNLLMEQFRQFQSNFLLNNFQLFNQFLNPLQNWTQQFGLALANNYNNQSSAAQFDSQTSLNRLLTQKTSKFMQQKFRPQNYKNKLSIARGKFRYNSMNNNSNNNTNYNNKFNLSGQKRTKFNQKPPLNLNNLKKKFATQEVNVEDEQNKVKFTLSPVEKEKENETTVTSSNINKIPMFCENGMDLDERFLDKTTSCLDVDYRQFEMIQTLVDQQDVFSVDKKIEQLQKEAEDKEKEEEEEEENEEELLELRKKLLDTVKQKRMLKKQQEEELKQQQEQQIDEDINLLRKKLLQHEKALMSSNDLVKQTSLSINTTTTVQTLTTQTTNTIQRSKLAPIIIRINPNEVSDTDEECVEPKQKKLQENIGQFLRQAKELATNQSETLKHKLPSQTNVLSTVPSNISKSESDLKKEAEKKDVIKSLRDRINLKSKMILELSKRSTNFKLIQEKKEKDIELTKLKIKMLKEQLLVAEKILNVNEQSLEKVKSEKRSTDLKLTKIQNMKKNQQEMLQKVLSSLYSKQISAITIQKSKEIKTTISNSQSSPSQISKNLSSQPPPPPTSPPKLSSQSIQIDKQKDEKLQPPLPPLPPSPQIQPPPPPPPSVEQSNLTQQSKPKSFIFAKLPSRMTLGGVVAETAIGSSLSSNITISKINKEKSNVSLFTMTRPNLYTSKLTNTKLEQLASQTNTQSKSIIDKNSTSQTSKNLNENIVINAKVVSGTAAKSKNHINQLEGRQKLNECLDELTRDYPYLYSETFDLWSYETILQPEAYKQTSLGLKNDILETNNEFSSVKPSCISVHTVLTSSNFSNLTDCERIVEKNLRQDSSEIYIIDDVANYQSPLNVFRGYRFSTHFSEFNQFEDAYSKLYCNAIDFRRPFCPFDLHGSCKDSNCIYQHSNIMTMDNYQRTEHFLSYCPQILDLSSEYPTQRETIKKLKLYAKNFMNNNLNRMSIKDYFKFLYDHVVENLKLEPGYSTILSRIPIMCLNNNKSIGVFDHLEFENENENEKECNSSLLNSSQLIKFNSNPSSNQPIETSDQLIYIFDLILGANLNRSLDVKLKKMLINLELDLEWLKNENVENYENKNELILIWIYYAKHVYKTSTGSSQIEKVLNVLSHSLESNSKCELLWLLYLKCYLFKKNSLNDYYEICMLCMDNLITYDLVWFILNTCPFEFIDLIFEKYEKYLLNVDEEHLSNEFEQAVDLSQVEMKSFERVSFYLCEMIILNTYLKLKLNQNDTKNESKTILNKYLNSSQILSKLEPNDLSLLWLCLIHLEAFSYLPNWLNMSCLVSKLSKSIETRSFWTLNKKRFFNMNFFFGINLIYRNRLIKPNESNQIYRQFDIFLIPWKQHQTKYSCSIEKLQNLFHESLKSINIKCPANSTTSLNKKQEIRMYSLPLFINLINLEVSNKRFEIGSKICERLLKSFDATYLKELWICLVYIQKQQQNVNQIEQTIQTMKKMFPKDPQIAYIVSQYYNLIDNKEKSIEIIEELIQNLYFSKCRINEININTLFRHMLGLDINLELKDKLDKIQTRFDMNSSCLLNFAILFCYYLELKNFNFDHICDTYEKLIKRTNLINFKTILWLRYFKYISSISLESNLVLNLINKCMNDLNQISKINNFIIPFNYLPLNYLNLNETNSTFTNHNYLNNNLLKTALSNRKCLYYSFNNDGNVDLFSYELNDNTRNEMTCFYYHNCVVDLLLKIYAPNQNDKFHLTKYLLDLMPFNSDLVKLCVSFSYKLNGLHKTLQMLYDHLSINSIDNEHLWVLCIKLCLDLNDLQQAVLIYHKAEMICSKHTKPLIELKRISLYLFPSVNESDVI